MRTWRNFCISHELEITLSWRGNVLRPLDALANCQRVTIVAINIIKCCNWNQHSLGRKGNSPYQTSGRLYCLFSRASWSDLGGQQLTCPLITLIIITISWLTWRFCWDSHCRIYYSESLLKTWLQFDMVHAVRCCKLRVLASKWEYWLGVSY